MGSFDPIDQNSNEKHNIFDDMLEYSVLRDVMKAERDSDYEGDDDYNEEDQ